MLILQCVMTMESWGMKLKQGAYWSIKNNKECYLRLDTNFVFEDLQPRLKDVDNDGEIEFITIQTSLQLGASVAVYKIINDKLVFLFKVMISA
jgi:hypothetical protein